MEGEEISNYVKENAKNVVSGGIKNLNLFTILQVAWLIELYYLGANSILEFVTNNSGGINIKVPTEIEEYNTLILGYFKEWSMFILFLIISMFICGISFLFLTAIPKLKNYNIIRVYSSYGLYAAGWLGLIFFTYYLYNNIGILFIFIEELKKKIKKYEVVQTFWPRSEDW